MLIFFYSAAFRALVEENVKVNVQRISKSDVITAVSLHFICFFLLYSNATISALRGSYRSISSLRKLKYRKMLADVFVHGWVYDMETGEVVDLGVSVAPPGREVPKCRFEGCHPNRR